MCMTTVCIRLIGPTYVVVLSIWLFVVFTFMLLGWSLHLSMWIKPISSHLILIYMYLSAPQMHHAVSYICEVICYVAALVWCWFKFSVVSCSLVPGTVSLKMQAVDLLMVLIASPSHISSKSIQYWCKTKECWGQREINSLHCPMPIAWPRHKNSIIVQERRQTRASRI